MGGSATNRDVKWSSGAGDRSDILLGQFVNVVEMERQGDFGHFFVAHRTRRLQAGEARMRYHVILQVSHQVFGVSKAAPFDRTPVHEFAVAVALLGGNGLNKRAIVLLYKTIAPHDGGSDCEMCAIQKKLQLGNDYLCSLTWAQCRA